jgi:hypothetical protein
MVQGIVSYLDRYPACSNRNFEILFSNSSSVARPTGHGMMSL